MFIRSRARRQTRLHRQTGRWAIARDVRAGRTDDQLFADGTTATSRLLDRRLMVVMVVRFALEIGQRHGRVRGDHRVGCQRGRGRRKVIFASQVRFFAQVGRIAGDRVRAAIVIAR